jgi:hypothetical protein
MLGILAAGAPSFFKLPDFLKCFFFWQTDNNQRADNSGGGSSHYGLSLTVSGQAGSGQAGWPDGQPRDKGFFRCLPPLRLPKFNLNQKDKNFRRVYFPNIQLGKMAIK